MLLLLLMLEAANADLVSTISLKRRTPNLQLSTSRTADYPISSNMSGPIADMLLPPFDPQSGRSTDGAAAYNKLLFEVHLSLLGVTTALDEIIRTMPPAHEDVWAATTR
jgi:hypothetical protein